MGHYGSRRTVAALGFRAKELCIEFCEFLVVGAYSSECAI